jgi:hypothetical protein
MLKEITISIIALIIIMQLYVNFSQNNLVIPEKENSEKDSKDKSNTDSKSESHSESNSESNSESKLSDKISSKKKNKKIKKEISANEKLIDGFANANNFKDFDYGQPHNTIMEADGPLYEWYFESPNPWSTIKNKPNGDFSFLFCVKTEVPSIDKFMEWKNIIPNLNFNPHTKELIIPANDEEGALSVTNLILNNFKNKISLQDIISKNLITISVNKAKKYSIVKTKLKEQIKNLLSNKNLSKGLKKPEYEADLSKAIKHRELNGPNAYNGLEFSFL